MSGDTYEVTEDTTTEVHDSADRFDTSDDSLVEAFGDSTDRYEVHEDSLVEVLSGGAQGLPGPAGPSGGGGGGGNVFVQTTAPTGVLPATYLWFDTDAPTLWYEDGVA